MNLLLFGAILFFSFGIAYSVEGDWCKRKQAGPNVIKHFKSSFQLSMNFSLLIIIKMPTTVGIFTFTSREVCMLSYVKQEKNAIVSN